VPLPVRIAILSVGCTVVGLVAVVAVSGTVLFANAASDPLRRVDAVVVLAGEHDGREDYGLQLVHAGVASVLVVSNPYPAGDQLMRRVCNTPQVGFEVLCPRPMPATTRGEALLVRQLAADRHWTSIVVVSWRFHLPRARLIFDECFPGSVVMRAVPRGYEYSLARWEYTYIYQYAAAAKALVQGSCRS
jgi:uncharacterized SAM-binding protein YcdF (DUF218 family)